MTWKDTTRSTKKLPSHEESKIQEEVRPAPVYSGPRPGTIAYGMSRGRSFYNLWKLTTQEDGSTKAECILEEEIYQIVRERRIVLTVEDNARVAAS